MTRKDGARPLDDRHRLMHMRDAATEALNYSRGRTRAELNSDGMLRRALKDCVQEIGEAAARVTDVGRAAAPTLPWPKIVGMRHRIVHVYYDIDLDALWAVVTNELSPLIQVLDAALVRLK